MGTYDRQIATAKRLIAKYGEVTQWTVPAVDEADPDKPWIIIPGVPVVKTPSIAFFPPSTLSVSQVSSINASLGYRPGEDVAQITLIGYMAAVDFDVNLMGVVKRKSGQELKLLTIQDLSPNGEKIMFMLVFK